MSDNLPGPHHCLGAARTAADIVYRSLHALCLARGGSMSTEDLERGYADILDSFGSGFDMFERRHLACQTATAGSAELPLARDRILATVLRVCGNDAARQAFTPQIVDRGDRWLAAFFDGFAHFIRQHICPAADRRLIAAYTEMGLAAKGKVSLGDILQQKDVQEVLRDCGRPMLEPTISAGLVRDLCDSVNAFMARRTAPETPGVVVDHQQITSFLSLLGRQIAVHLPLELKLRQAELYSLAEHKKKSGAVI